MSHATADVEELPIDPEGAIEHVRDAWLNLRIFDEVDVGTGGGYAFDPSDYAPVSIEQGGERVVVFAKL